MWYRRQFIGPDGYCSPRHLTHVEPPSRELNGTICVSRHVTQRTLKPRLVSKIVHYDVASNIFQALPFILGDVVKTTGARTIAGAGA